MKFITTIIIVLIVALVIMLPQIFFSVDETEVAIVTRFGEITSEITEPGLNIKTPFIESVTRYEKRLLVFDAQPDSLLTKDKKRLIIDVYARGRIVDPALFRERLGNEQAAADRAIGIISSELRSEVASHNQSEIITTQRDQIMNTVLVSVSPQLEEFGITVVDVRIKRADFPSEIAESVYSRMRAERQRKADKERAEGNEIDAQVRADADRKATIILANANRDSRIITGCGDAESTSVFADALEQDPEFYSFQRSLEASKSILSTDTTTVMGPEEFASVFSNIQNAVDVASKSSDGTDSNDSVDVSSQCAEVSAAWYLASDLQVDQPDITFLSSELVEWPNNSLGCVSAESSEESKLIGYEVEFSHLGNIHKVRTNQFGSNLAICD